MREKKLINYMSVLNDASASVVSSNNSVRESKADPTRN